MPSPALSRSEPAHSLAFAGRGGELDQLERALSAPGALVTVWGPPGVGKTRLVEESGRRTALPLVLVRAIDVGDEAALVTRICRALEIPDRTQGSLGDLAGPLERVAEQGAVLVLDALDRLASTVAPGLDALRRSVPALRVLVTAREILGLPDEQVLHLDALPVDDAVELLVSRAEKLWYGSREDDRARLRALVERFDRLPLALELGASWLAVLGPRGLEEHLDSGVPHSDGDSSLDRAIARSWASLSPDERDALASLSIFPGSLDAAAAAAVLDASPTRALELLHTLIARSLVSVQHHGSRTRFRLLVSIRDFALVRLAEAGRRAHVERAHAAHYARAVHAWVARLDGAAPAEGMDALRRERDNLVAGALHGEPGDRITLVLALERLLHVDGPFGLLADLLDRAADAARSDEHVSSERIQLLLAARAEARRCTGDGEAALALAAEIPDGGAPEACVRARITRGLVAFVRGDLESARSHATIALEMATRTGEERLHCQARFLAGNVAMALGDHDAASEHAERALEIARPRSWQRDAAGLEVFLGGIRIDEGRTADAELLLESARARVGAGVDRQYDANATVLDAMIAHRRGRLDVAVSLYRAAAGHARDLGGSGWLAAVHDGYAAMALVELGRASEAEALLTRALERVRTIGDRRYEALFESYLAAVDLEGAEANDAGLERARTRVDRARALAESTGDLGFLAAVGYHEARVLRVEGVRAATAGAAGEAARLTRTRREVVAACDARVRDARGRVRSIEAHASRRLYEASLGDSHPVDEAPLDALVLGPELGWFRAPRGDVVDLEKKPLLRALVQALVDAASESRKLDRDALRKAGWGDERMSQAAAGNRLRVALAALRKLGLRDVLRHDSEGWWLALDVPVVRLDAGEPPARGAATR